MEGKGVNLQLQRDTAGTSGKFKRSGWGVKAAQARKEQNKTRHLRQDLKHMQEYRRWTTSNPLQHRHPKLISDPHSQAGHLKLILFKSALFTAERSKCLVT